MCGFCSSADTEGLDYTPVSEAATTFSFLLSLMMQVAFMEFKLDKKDITTAVGQVVNRCRAIFNQQLQRGFIIALVVTCQEVQLLRVTEHKASRGIQVQMTKPLSLSAMVGNQEQLSMDAHGVDIIARFLAATVEQHDYRAPVMPAPIEFSNLQGIRFKLTGFVQIWGEHGNPGQVYRAESQQQQDDNNSMEVDVAAETVVVKVLHNLKEVSKPHVLLILRKLLGCRGVPVASRAGLCGFGELVKYAGPFNTALVLLRTATPPYLHQFELVEKISAASAEDSQHLVRMEGSFTFPGDERLSLVLKPYCELPGSDVGVAKLSRLGWDVAQAIENLFRVRIIAATASLCSVWLQSLKYLHLLLASASAASATCVAMQYHHLCISCGST